MLKEAIGTGATVDEAKENALAALNVDSTKYDVDFEILEFPKKKTLGLFGGSPAKVRVFFEMPDPKPKKKEAPARKQEKTAPAEKKAPVQKKTQNQKPAPVAKQPQKDKPAPVQESTVPEQDAPKAAPFQAEEKPVEMKALSELPADCPALKATDYLSKVLACMGVTDVEMTVGEIESGWQINLSGENLGVIIGRRGETLDALQYLTFLATNSGNGYCRVVLNTGNYRQKREDTLRALARRMSNQVLRTGRSRSLEPMSPYERRIIHTTVQEIEGVSSNSIGEGAGRRVVIVPEGGSIRSSSGNRDRRGGRNDRNRGGRRPERAPQPQSTRAPKSDLDDGTLLEGVINLTK